MQKIGQFWNSGCVGKFVIGLAVLIVFGFCASAGLGSV
jgi:hypothetical protein